MDIFNEWIKSSPFHYKVKIGVDNDDLIYPIQNRIKKVKKGELMRTLEEKNRCNLVMLEIYIDTKNANGIYEMYKKEQISTPTFRKSIRDIYMSGRVCWALAELLLGVSYDY